MSLQGLSVASAAVLMALAGAPALAGGSVHVSVNSGLGCNSGLRIGGSYSSHGGFHSHSGFGVSFNTGYCGPRYYSSCYPSYRSCYYPSYSYCYPRVIYAPPVVYVPPAPVVYTVPVTYTSPQVIERQVVQQPVVYQQPVVESQAQQATYQLPVATRPVTTTQTVTEVTQPAATERVTTTQTTAQVVLTPYEAGLRAIQDRKSGEAIDQLNEHLRLNPGDARAMRLVALMYAEQNNCSEAAVRMLDAYRHDPNLVNQPVDAAALGIGPGRMRDITNNAERYSMKLKTGSSYLVTSVLMQAEGRQADAAAMARNAETAGLENGIGANLQAALR